MPKGVIKVFKIIQIHHDHRDCAAGARRPAQFTGERLFEIAPIEKSSEGIANRLVPQQFSKPEVRQCQRHTLRCANGAALHPGLLDLSGV